MRCNCSENWFPRFCFLNLYCYELYLRSLYVRTQRIWFFFLRLDRIRRKPYKTTSHSTFLWIWTITTKKGQNRKQATNNENVQCATLHMMIRIWLIIVKKFAVGHGIHSFQRHTLKFCQNRMIQQNLLKRIQILEFRSIWIYADAIQSTQMTIIRRTISLHPLFVISPKLWANNAQILVQMEESVVARRNWKGVVSRICIDLSNLQSKWIISCYLSNLPSKFNTWN